MKKICLFLCLLTAAVSGWSASVPDNMYFHAMKDEMTRSLKKLRMKENPKPYYNLNLILSSSTINILKISLCLIFLKIALLIV